MGGAGGADPGGAPGVPVPVLDALVLAAEKLLSPAAPGVVRLLASGEPDLDGLRAALEVDPVLTVKVLDHANHSFYARRAPAADLRRALARLGWDTSSRLLLRLVMEGATGSLPEAHAERLWAHAARVAVVARLLAREAGTLDAGLAYTAGLCHGLGQLGLLAVHRARYTALLDQHPHGPRLARLERDTFHVTHAAVGAGLLARMRVPDALPGAVERQYRSGLAERDVTGRPDLALAAVLQLAHIALHDDGARLGDPAILARQPLSRRLALGPEAFRDLPGRLERLLAPREEREERAA